MKKPIYYFKDEMRYVMDYTHIHKAYAKKRWFGKTILNVFLSEFKEKNEIYYKDAIEKEKILINNKKCSPDDKIKDGMLLTHERIIKEKPVTAKDILVVLEEKDFMVVDKPPGMVVHPSGSYHFNTLSEILKFEKNYEFCSVINRLDKEVSGLVIISKNKEFSNKMRIKMQERFFQKEYICIVDGLFPEKICCSEPLYFDYQKKKAIVNQEHSLKKEAFCTFKRKAFKDNKSLVSCFPETGRTHQIRAHLHFLGYPISNDHVYNPKAKKTNSIYLRAICYTDKVENKKFKVALPDWAFSF